MFENDNRMIATPGRVDCWSSGKVTTVARVNMLVELACVAYK